MSEKQKSTSYVCYAARIDRKIDRIKKAIETENYTRLRREINIRKRINKVLLIKKAKGEIEYLKYIKHSIKNRKEIRKSNTIRIRNNYKLFKYGKRKKDFETTTEHPSKEVTEAFWKKIFQNNRNINEREPLIREIISCTEDNFENVIITLGDVECALSQISNWKAPGNDKIHGFWLKYVKCITPFLIELFNRWINNTDEIPKGMLHGRTSLLFKGGDPLEPKNYRPVTCLNTILKAFTTIIKNKIEKQLQKNPPEKQLSQNQLGSKKLSYASKEGLIQSILLQSYLNRRKKNIVKFT